MRWPAETGDEGTSPGPSGSAGSDGEDGEVRLDQSKKASQDPNSDSLSVLTTDSELAMHPNTTLVKP